MSWRSATIHTRCHPHEPIRDTRSLSFLAGEASPTSLRNPYVRDEPLPKGKEVLEISATEVLRSAAGSALFPWRHRLPRPSSPPPIPALYAPPTDPWNPVLRGRLRPPCTTTLLETWLNRTEIVSLPAQCPRRNKNNNLLASAAAHSACNPREIPLRKHASRPFMPAYIVRIPPSTWFWLSHRRTQVRSGFFPVHFFRCTSSMPKFLSVVYSSYDPSTKII